MKQIILIVCAFAVMTIVSGAFLYWGFIGLSEFDVNEGLVRMCKIVGVGGVIGFPYLCGKMVSEEREMIEEGE
jgi:uncharacterized membrane protein YuzA (DUF378 family)